MRSEGTQLDYCTRKYVPPYLGNALLNSDEINNLVDAIHRKAVFRYQEDRHTFSKSLEVKFAKFFNIPYAHVLVNASVALRIALQSLCPRVGEVVLIPAVSYIATANCCLSAGLIPHLIDVDNTGHLDESALLDYLHKYPKPCAVIAVHLDGSGASIHQISSICKEWEIPLIEDVAQSFSVQRQGKYLGTWGDIGCFSFQANKILSAGEGGLIITNSDLYHERICALSDQGSLRNEKGYPSWTRPLGYGENLKINELTSAVIEAQFNKLSYIKSHLLANYKSLLPHLSHNSIKSRSHDDLPLSIWIENPSYKDALLQKEIALYSWEHMLLTKHPIITEKRTLYADYFPWNHEKFEYMPNCKTAERIAQRYCLPVKIIKEEHRNTLNKIKMV